ncbi:MAG TPA: glycine betaine ABC transporter substrate-binding protein [Acidimicrobiales bacterium]|jgi:osmoprotectant transport system substrate-binding protein|nr:glycine betaine ABC transporter substrate-binding protein [Acidimicrobiales bacterium]
MMQVRSGSRRRRPLAVGAALGLCVAMVLSGCTSSKSSKAATSTGGAAATFHFKPLDSGGPLTVDALKQKSIDIAVLFSVDGHIPAYHWVVLQDDKHLQAPDHFVPAIRTSAATPAVTKVLDAVSAKITPDAIQNMVKSVVIDGQDADAVAKDWLQTNKLPGDLTATGNIKVGSANFPESQIVGDLYYEALKSAGVTVENKPNIGAREVYLPALENGSLDLVPEFTATLLTFLDPKATVSQDLATVTADAKKLAEAKGFTLLTPAPADDVNVYVVRSDTASKYGLKTISDLAKVKDELTMGGPPECPTREPCLLGLEKVYGLKFKQS